MKKMLTELLDQIKHQILEREEEAWTEALQNRWQCLGLKHFQEYQAYLQQHPEEWKEALLCLEPSLSSSVPRSRSRAAQLSNHFLPQAIPAFSSKWLATAFDQLDPKEPRFYQELIENTQEGVWVIDARNRTLYVNQIMAQILGYTPEEMQGRDFFDFMDEETRYYAKTNIERRKKGISEQYDFCFLSKNQEAIWTLVSSSPIQRGDGYAGALMLVNDITERKAIEEELLRSKYFIERITENIPGIITLYHPQREAYFYVSSAIESILGFTAQELSEKGRTWIKQRIHPEDRSLVGEKNQQMRENWQKDGTRQTVAYEYRVRNHRLEWVWVKTYSAVFSEDAQGNIEYIINITMDISEQKKAQIQMEKLFSVSADLLCLIDFKGNFIKINQNWNRVLGYEEKDLIGKSFLSMVHPQDQLLTEKESLEIMEGKTAILFNNRYQGADGKYHWLNWTAQSVPEERIIFAAARNITEQKHSEQLLADNLHFIQKITDANPGIIFIHDLPSRQNIYTNRSIEKILGYTIEEFKQMDRTQVIQRVHPDDLTDVIRHYDRLSRAEEDDIWEIEYRVQHQAGHWVWLLTREMIFNRDADGNPLQIIGTSSDISHKKEIEQALKESEKKHRLLVELSPVGILVSDGKSILFANPEAAEILGTSQLQDLIGKNLYDFIHPDFSKINQERNQRILEDYLTTEKEEEKFIRLDQQIIDVEIVGSPIIYDGTKAVQMLFQDITERNQQQQNLNLLNEELMIRNQELEVQEEELASTNEELLAQQEELKRALDELSDRNFELDQLVYKTSHDLRSPLTTILGLISVIKIEEQPAQQMEYIRLIENRVLKLDEFIRSMLNYAKANRSELQSEVIDFEEIIKSCQADLEYLENFSRIKLNIEILPEDAIFQSDYLRLRIIFSNIISNAYKYANPHAKRNYVNVQIQLYPMEAIITFKDNGIGIEQEHLDKIFDMFYRATSKSDGSGLGMYIVKQTVDKLHGQIQISSTFGKGTRIQIVIPNQI